MEQKRSGVLASILGFFSALLSIVQVFFATLFSPDAHAAAKSKRLDSMGGGRGPGGGRPGGGGGGPRGGRIVGVDKLGGGGGAAACPTG